MHNGSFDVSVNVQRDALGLRGLEIVTYAVGEVMDDLLHMGRPEQTQISPWFNGDDVQSGGCLSFEIERNAHPDHVAEIIRKALEDATKVDDLGSSV